MEKEKQRDTERNKTEERERKVYGSNREDEKNVTRQSLAHRENKQKEPVNVGKTKKHRDRGDKLEIIETNT